MASNAPQLYTDVKLGLPKRGFNTLQLEIYRTVHQNTPAQFAISSHSTCSVDISKPMTTGNAQPVFVLAPGAWHTPDCYDVVRDKLNALGWETRGVTYPSVGAEPPNKGAFDDAAAVRAEVQTLVDQGRQVILVGHSYGGFVISEASKDLGYKQRKADGKEGGIVLLIFLSAFVVPKGLSLLKMLGGNPLPWMDVQVSSRTCSYPV